MAPAKVGLIGTGIMGTPMARNLLRAGYRVYVFSRTQSRARPLVDDGAAWRDSPAEVARECETVITMVSDSPDVEAAFLGEKGICSGMKAGTLCIDMSTIDPAVAQRIGVEVSRRGCSFLDAPVSGGKIGAETGKLVIMAGGTPEDIARARPLFEVLGKHVVHCGPTGCGQLAKLCNQIICALNLLAVSEAVAFAHSVGLNPEVMLEAVRGGAAGSWAVEHLGPRMVAGDFAPMFMIDLQQKDLRLALDAARAHPTPLPGTALVHQLLASNQAHGEGRDGTQALLKTLERLAGRHT